jgi:hypothetical protein
MKEDTKKAEARNAEEIVNQVLTEAENYAFQVPYDGSNNFYNDKKLWEFIRKEMPKAMESYASLREAQAVEKLQAFKDYVHKRLDDAGVSVDPESPHKAAGCRIGGRLDIVLKNFTPTLRP